MKMKSCFPWRVQVKVSQQNSPSDEQVTVTTLSKGDWFGEQALKGWRTNTKSERPLTLSPRSPPFPVLRLLQGGRAHGQLHGRGRRHVPGHRQRVRRGYLLSRLTINIRFNAAVKVLALLCEGAFVLFVCSLTCTRVDPDLSNSWLVDWMMSKKSSAKATRSRKSESVNCFKLGVTFFYRMR